MRPKLKHARESSQSVLVPSQISNSKIVFVFSRYVFEIVRLRTPLTQVRRDSTDLVVRFQRTAKVRVRTAAYTLFCLYCKSNLYLLYRLTCHTQRVKSAIGFLNLLNNSDLYFLRLGKFQH